MRKAFVSTLADLAEQDRRIVLLTGDLGFGVVDAFAGRFPDRFINVGVAEQNLVAVATGLAEAGYLPFAYSIASFLTLRPYEFIRNGPILHRLPVRMAGVGGGAEYGHQGLTHYALEDYGIMRLQPGLMVVTPADALQAKAALRVTWDVPGPVYYRLGKDDAAVVPGLEGRFDPNRVEMVRHGRDLLFLAAGAIAGEAVAAAELIAADGFAAAVGVVSTLNPAPSDLPALVERFRVVVAVEAHYVAGGLGSLVSELVGERDLACRVVRCGFRRMPHSTSGSQQYLYAEHGLTRDAIRDAARLALDSAASAQRRG
jgi:transketolase